MKWGFIIGVHVGMLIAAYLLAPKHRVEIEPYHPLPYTPYAWKDELVAAKRFVSSDHRGFENVVFDEKGRLFASAPDAIYQIDLAKNTSTEFVYTGHFPAFMLSDGKGKLLVGDFVQGLLEIDLETKEITSLLKKVDGLPLKFTETITLARNGEDLYVTDGAQQSMLYAPDQTPNPIFSSMYAGVQAKYDGRLIHYNRRTKVAKTIVTGFIFANGIALDKDENSIFVVDTFTNNISRVWINGPKAGKVEVALDRIPCIPDNLARADKLGGFFVSCVDRRSGLLDFIHPYPILKKLISALPMSLIPYPPPFAACLHLDEDGKIIHGYSDSKGVTVHSTTTCLEKDGTLYFSGMHYDGVASYKVQ